MRSPSITLLSFAALSASLVEGAALPQDASSSAASSRRSSIASISSTSVPTSTASWSTVTTPQRPGFKLDVFGTTSSTTTTTTTTSSSSSSFASSSSSSSAATTSSSSAAATSVSPFTVVQANAATKANGRPGFVVQNTSSTTSSKSPSSTAATSTKNTSSSSSIISSSSSMSSSSTVMSSASTRRSSSLLNPTVTTTSVPYTSSSTFSSSRRSSVPAISSSSRYTTTSQSSSQAQSSTSSSRPISTSSSWSSSSSKMSSSSSSSYSSSIRAASSSLRYISSSPLAPASASMVRSSTISTFSSARAASTTASSVPDPARKNAQVDAIQPDSSVAASSSSTAPASSVRSTASAVPTSSHLTSSSAVPIKSIASSAAQASGTVSSVATRSSGTATRPVSSAASSAVSSVASARPSTTVSIKPIDFGCWYDTASNRTMTGPSYTDSTAMTHETCSSFCSSHGMPFSGTEYGSECYCSETVPVSKAATWCNMPCPGDSTEICGSGDALSVMYVPPISNSLFQSTSLGCYADSVNARTMTGASFTSSSMTNEACASFCTVEGYTYSGTEYGSQCFCSNDSPWSASVGCGMACAGDSSEICGDGNALSVTKLRQQGSVNGTSASRNATTTAAAKATVPSVDLNAKFQSWSTWKARGVNLGNWLLLEQWMYPSWFDNTAPGAVDEWTFCSSLGAAACTTALQQHWATFITEDDISNMAQLNVNTMRIPIGFWAFIDPLTTEPYIRSTQLQELTRVLGYAQNHGMTVVLDIHGLPGSQNGMDHSGHTGSVGFYTTANQARSLQAVQAAATWIAASGYAGSVISALEVANEPAIADWSTWLQYKDYVLASHTIVQATVPSVATMFHDGFWPLAPWNQFFSASDNAVIDTHKYWAFEATTLTQAESDVCSYVDQFAAINLPVFVGEFSLSISADVSSFVGYAVGFFESQMSVWLQAAGAAFWSVKVTQDNGQQNDAWSASGILASGVFNGADVWSFSQAATCQ